MKNFKIKLISSLLALATFTSACEFGDLNNDPDSLVTAPIEQQLTSLTVNVGFLAGSDLNRYSSLISQQFSGQSRGGLSQTQQYESFQISGNDSNNVWANLYATVLNDAENIINLAKNTNSPHYSGVAKILKAYVYQVAVDTWGAIPYFEAQQLTNNLKPKYDKDEFIYGQLVSLLDQGINEVKALNSLKSPSTNSTIYPGDFSITKNNWIRFANTLKLRLFLHYSEKNAAFAKSNIDNLVNSSATFFASNSDNFQMNFTSVANGQNPIHQFEIARPGYLVANAKLVNMMNAKSDPRRSSYFTKDKLGNYLGAVAGAPAVANGYSKLHTYLRGNYNSANGVYTGAAPIRMMTFAEYNFIRAEAALRFSSPGDADAFFKAGVRASMQDAGVADVDIDNYINTYATLSGTDIQKLEMIINEKYIANYGVVLEPWSDWRRTGFPTLSLPSTAVVGYIPRSLYYPQSEIDTNSGNVIQKTGLNVRVFWDTRN
ncbi:SusD/RagB family nutrient-binding outer membrane lipoprotein [Flavobacterium oreochromis]|uniref:SusD/RagB family nutrient-binding outer membrane lipoprotein n=1 Tax=Flavobacterium columnare TaxID=996 RepID=A0A2D0AI11_9FLAO|nr:SusD/RagB family nutrient-binding outer membrane lipoprotein [Flavobacterium oreochromis]OWP79454.1 hypothetical protein BWK62_01805 [Flavobacterium oreochromis]